VLALAAIAYILASVTAKEWAVVGGVMVAAAVIYAIERAARRRAG
jgi:hypothetical protein